MGPSDVQGATVVQVDGVKRFAQLARLKTGGSRIRGCLFLLTYTFILRKTMATISHAYA